jgi:hypothetical protein
LPLGVLVSPPARVSPSSGRRRRVQLLQTAVGQGAGMDFLGQRGRCGRRRGCRFAVGCDLVGMSSRRNRRNDVRWTSIVRLRRTSEQKEQKRTLVNELKPRVVCVFLCDAY